MRKQHTNNKEKIKSTIDNKIEFFEKRYNLSSSEIHSNYNKIVNIKTKQYNGFDDYHEWSSLLSIKERIINNTN